VVLVPHDAHAAPETLGAQSFGQLV
jgi:hypothetical protein